MPNNKMNMTKKEILICLLFAQLGFTQTATIQFYPIEAESFRSIQSLQVHLPDTIITTHATQSGRHAFVVPLGTYDIGLQAETRRRLNLSLVVQQPDEVKDLGQILFFRQVEDEMSLGVLNLTEEELDSDSDESLSASTYLNTVSDVFYRTVAFHFSSTFFRPRGLDSSHRKVLINDIEMNKLNTGRPQWSNWGGLNDVMRNQIFAQGSQALPSHFGGLIGSTNINTSATQFGKGSRVTYSHSNRSYQHRLLVSHRSGVLDNGWGYVTAFGLRRGLSGTQEGTFYDATSALLSIDKVISPQHQLNLTAIYTPVRRGKGSSYTKEVAEIKGNIYNSYWGWQNNSKRNARVARIAEPLLMFSHRWHPKPAMAWRTTIAYQFGEIGNSRLDYPGGTNPDPTYYQKLPSYFLSTSSGPDYEKAYQAKSFFEQNGQINWEAIYQANQTKTALGKPAAYALYEDREDQSSLAISSTVETQLNHNQQLHLSLRYRKMQSENFATPIDLLGGLPLQNTDPYDHYAYDLDSPTTHSGLGDPYRYRYLFDATRFGLHAKFEINNPKSQVSVASKMTQTAYQRNGLFRNGGYPNSSKGMSKQLTFLEIGMKAGVKINLRGRHWINSNLSYIKRPPTLQNSFSNPRENNHIVGEFSNTPLKRETIVAAELSYLFRSPITDIRLTIYGAQERDVTDVSYFFADGIGGDTAAFIQEVVYGITKNHIGLEWGMQTELLPVLTLNSVAALGYHTHAKNPFVYATSQDFEEEFIDFGESKLNNTRLAFGPQNALALGISYQDPNFWRLGLTYSYYTHSYLSISPILRTQNFILDDDGLPFTDYDPNKAKGLLTPERFDDYGLLNLTASKSWKINQMYIGWFMGINNLLGTSYISGGYEQSRSANYRSLSNDVDAPARRFGPKYWYGRGTNFFMNLSLRL